MKLGGGRDSFRTAGSAQQLGEKQTGQNQQSAEGGSPAQSLAQQNIRRDPGKDRLQGEDEPGVGRADELLRPRLNGEGCRQAQKSGNQNGGDDARRPDDVQSLQHGCGGKHKSGGGRYLDNRQRLERILLGSAANGNNLKGKSYRADDSEPVPFIHTGKIAPAAGRASGNR